MTTTPTRPVWPPPAGSALPEPLLSHVHAIALTRLHTTYIGPGSDRDLTGRPRWHRTLRAQLRDAVEPTSTVRRDLARHLRAYDVWGQDDDERVDGVLRSVVSELCLFERRSGRPVGGRPGHRDVDAAVGRPVPRGRTGPGFLRPPPSTCSPYARDDRPRRHRRGAPRRPRRRTALLRGVTTTGPPTGPACPSTATGSPRPSPPATPTAAASSPVRSDAGTSSACWSGIESPGSDSPPSTTRAASTPRTGTRTPSSRISVGPSPAARATRPSLSSGHGTGG